MSILESELSYPLKLSNRWGPPHKAAGRRVVWAIAGRANLADSYRLSQDYFRGYRDVFSENLYVYPMSEFSREQVS
jgi:hypothetical protein